MTDPRWRIQGTMRRAFLCKDPEVLVTGPAGTGKTIADHLLTMLRCQEYPGSRHLYVRQVRADMNDTILPSFERVLGPGHPALGDGCGPESRHRYTFPNGALVVVAGLDRPQRTYSGEYDTVTVFEGTDTTEDAWQQFKRSLRHGKMPFSQLRMECNPDSQSHWIKRRADAGIMTAFYTTHKDNPAYWDEEKGDWTPQGREYVLGTLASLTGFRRARLFLGEWVGAEGLIYDNFEPTRNAQPYHVRSRSFEAVRRFVAIDDGTSDPFVCLLFESDKAGRVHISSEVHERGYTTDRKIAAVHRFKPDAAVVDSAALGLKMDINQSGVQTPMAVKDILPGIAQVRNWFSRTIEGEPAITIDPSCTNLIESIQSYAWDPKASKEKPLGGNDHGADALRYGLMHMQDPPAIVFDSPKLSDLIKRCDYVPFVHATIAHELQDGSERDLSLAKQEVRRIRLYPASDTKATVRVWCDLDKNLKPSQANRYAMFCVPCDIGGENVTLFAVGDGATKSIVADGRFKGTPEECARLSAMLGLWFHGDGLPALLGWWHQGAMGTAFQSALRRIQYPRQWLGSPKTGEGWSPDKLTWNDAVSLLRVAWEMGQFNESDPDTFRHAAGYGWHGGVVRPLAVADDVHRWATWGDLVIVRAGLWQMLRNMTGPAAFDPMSINYGIVEKGRKENDLARM
jgi:phage terminase large subunit